MAEYDKEPISLLTGPRRAILSALKEAGSATIPLLAGMLAISTEAVRQQLSHLQRGGWVTSDCGPDEDDDSSQRRGRPPADYCLSPEGDDLFPKRYPALATALFDRLNDPERILSDMTDERVASLEHRLPRAPLERRLEGLRSIYIADDPFTTVEKSDRGYVLIERNCPYLQFALERPLFCSTTVSALRRLTNFEVVREDRFQDGDGRCVFHIYSDSPAGEKHFEREPPKNRVPTVRS